jgi:hypothetical protein
MGVRLKSVGKTLLGASETEDRNKKHIRIFQAVHVSFKKCRDVCQIRQNYKRVYTYVMASRYFLSEWKNMQLQGKVVTPS